MKKRILLISVMVIVLVLSLFAFIACNNADVEIGKELIKNGDFSQFDENVSKFNDWSANSDRYARYDDYLKINNSSANTTYLKQTVEVAKNQIYKVSVDIKIDAALSGKVGAFVGFIENVDHQFVAQKEKSNGFTTYTFYVKPKNTDTLTITLNLGATGATSKGVVYFDNVSMMAVDQGDVPFNATVTEVTPKTSDKDVDVPGTVFVVMLTLASVAFILGAYIAIKRIYAKHNAFSNIDESVVARKNEEVKVAWYKNVWFICALLMLLTFVIRLIIMLTTYGFGTSLTQMLVTGREVLIKDNGLITYFEKYPTSTYSPGVVYILTILGAATKNLSINSASVLFRFINVLADMAVVAMIYFYGRKQVGNKLSSVYAALYAVLPFTFVMSGFYSGFESVLVALLVGAVLLMINKKYLATYFVMTLASVLDIRALALAPIVVAYFVYMYIKDGDIKKFTPNRAKIVFGLVGSVVLAYLLTLPIGFNQIAAGDAFFNFKVIMKQLTNVTQYTLYAFGLYGMVAMNGQNAIQGVKILNLVFTLVLEAYVITLYFKNRNRQELILLASFTLAILAVFTIKVNFTYLVLSLALALIYTMISGDKRMYLISGGISTLGFLNIAQLMNQSGYVSKISTTALVSFPSKDVFYIFFSVVTVILMGYYAYVCYSITNNSKIVDIKAMDYPLSVTIKNGFRSLKAKLSKNDEE